MVAFPAAMPVTIPVAELIVATAVLVLLHVPHAVASDKFVVRPVHTLVTPVIAAGVRFTVITCVVFAPQPVLKVIVAVPVAVPVTTPVVAATVATPALLLVHVLAQALPVEAFVNVGVAAVHTLAAPAIVAGLGITVTVAVLKHPLLMV